MRDRVEAGNHTLYLRVTEELSDGDEDPRYFDLPLKIEVKESLEPGRIFVERISGLTPFLPNQEQNIEFQIENSNNIQNLIFEISKKYGVALITATHDNEFIKLFDRVYRLENSKLSISNE